MPEKEMDRIREAAQHLEERLPETPRLTIVLGSGLSGLAGEIEGAVREPYGEIPHWPVSGVEGHEGCLVAGRLAGVPVAVLAGRVHLYEGHEPAVVVRAVRSLSVLGCPAFLLTNAAGGIATGLVPGSLLWIRDHLNLTGANPLTGPNLDDLGPRFPDMSAVYERVWRSLAEDAAEAAGIDLRPGVYAALAGPSYETPAEIGMLRTLGADAVGMSTVPEAIALRHAGAEVGGVSLITNMAAGILDTPLSHAEVTETAERVKGPFADFVTRLVAAIGGGE